jgi:DNA-binding MarR family transcriptional regulator
MARRVPRPRRRDSATRPLRPTAAGEAARIDAFVPRGPECAYANARMLGRVVGAFYDEMLRPADLRAAQLALLWAIIAREPVDQKALGRITQTDQTTLSRTVEHLRADGLVVIEPGVDRRTRMIRLSAKGRMAFARALPYWDEAQRKLAGVVSVEELSRLARAARRFARTREAEGADAPAL